MADEQAASDVGRSSDYSFPPTAREWYQLQQRMGATERVALRNREWLMELGVDDMSTLERQALAPTIRDSMAWRRARKALVVGGGLVIGALQIFAPVIDHALGIGTR